jgi:hypothetical protein
VIDGVENVARLPTDVHRQAKPLDALGLAHADHDDESCHLIVISNPHRGRSCWHRQPVRSHGVVAVWQCVPSGRVTTPSTSSSVPHRPTPYGRP